MGDAFSLWSIMWNTEVESHHFEPVTFILVDFLCNSKSHTSFFVFKTTLDNNDCNGVSPHIDNALKEAARTMANLEITFVEKMMKHEKIV